MYFGGKYKIDSLEQLALGFCLVKFDQTGKIANTTFRELLRKSLGFWNGNAKNENDKIAEGYGINDFFYYKEENSFYFILEESWTSSGDTPRGQPGTRGVFNEYHFNTLLFIKMKEGHAKEEWIRGLPKVQVESVTTYGDVGLMLAKFAIDNRSYPFYSSFTSSRFGDKLILLVNDHRNNNDVTRAEDDYKTVSDFDKSVLYAIILNLKDGSYQRKKIFDNTGHSEIFMPRFSMLKENMFYIPAQNIRTPKLSEFRIDRITVK